jgi:hypothetical protein
MKAKFYKKILSETSIIHGLVNMPKNFEINRLKLKEDIVYSSLILKEKTNLNTYYLPNKRYKVDFSKALDMLNIYLIDYLNLNYKFSLVNLDIWGNIYFPNEASELIRDMDPLDLRNSPDYIMLYGVDINDLNSKITFYYNDNRKKDREYTMSLLDNQFLFFPSTVAYKIHKNKSEDLNTVLTITYKNELN